MAELLREHLDILIKSIEKTCNVDALVSIYKYTLDKYVELKDISSMHENHIPASQETLKSHIVDIINDDHVSAFESGSESEDDIPNINNVNITKLLNLD